MSSGDRKVRSLRERLARWALEHDGTASIVSTLVDGMPGWRCAVTVGPFRPGEPAISASVFVPHDRAARLLEHERIVREIDETVAVRLRQLREAG